MRLLVFTNRVGGGARLGFVIFDGVGQKEQRPAGERNVIGQTLQILREGVQKIEIAVRHAHRLRGVRPLSKQPIVFGEEHANKWARAIKSLGFDPAQLTGGLGNA